MNAVGTWGTSWTTDPRCTALNVLHMPRRGKRWLRQHKHRPPNLTPLRPLAWELNPPTAAALLKSARGLVRSVARQSRPACRPSRADAAAPALAVRLRAPCHAT